MNANLKMNTNTPFESGNIWASRERGSRPKAGEAQLKRLRTECPPPRRVRHRNKTEAAKQTPIINVKNELLFHSPKEAVTSSDEEKEKLHDGGLMSEFRQRISEQGDERKHWKKD